MVGDGGGDDVPTVCSMALHRYSHDWSGMLTYDTTKATRMMAKTMTKTVIEKIPTKPSF